MLKQGQDKLEEKEDIVELDVEGAVKSEYPNPMFKRAQKEKMCACAHMLTKYEKEDCQHGESQ